MQLTKTLLSYLLLTGIVGYTFYEYYNQSGLKPTFMLGTLIIVTFNAVTGCLLNGKFKIYS